MRAETSGTPVQPDHDCEAAVRVAALVRHNVVLLLREPGPVAGRLVLPLVFVLLMHPLYVAVEGDGPGTVQVVTGTLVMFSLLALSIVGNGILAERIWRTWNRMRSSAAHPAELLVGKAVPVMSALLAQQLLILAFGAGALGMSVVDPALLVLVCVCWSLALLCVGAALGLLARSFSELSAVYDVGGLILSGLAGAVVPLTRLPDWAHAVAPVSPGYWALSGLRGALRGETGATLVACGVLLVFAAVGALVVYLRITRAGGRTTNI